MIIPIPGHCLRLHIALVNQIYPPEWQLNKDNTSDIEATFFDFVYLFITVLFPPKFMINAMTLLFNIFFFLFWMVTLHVVPFIECIFLKLYHLLECIVM